MSLHQIPYIISLIINTALFFYILAQDKKNPANLSFLAFTGCLIWWFSIGFLVEVDLLISQRIWFFKLESLGWYLLGFFFVSFVYHLMGRKKDFIHKSIQLIGYASILVSLLTDLVVKGSLNLGGKGYMVAGALHVPLIFINIVFPTLFGTYLLIRGIIQTTDQRIRKQFILIVSGGMATLTLSITTGVILPHVFNMYEYGDYVEISTTIFTLSIFIAIIRYGFFKLNFGDVAQQLFSRISDVVLVLDDDMRILECTEKGRALFDIHELPAGGIPAEKVLDRKWLDGEGEIEIVIEKNNKTEFYQLSKSSLSGNIRGSKGQLYFFKNITLRKQAEIKLTESEANYRSLVELSPNVVLVHRQGKVLYINQAGVRLFGGNSPQSFYGRSVMDFVHPDFKEKVAERMKKAQQGMSLDKMDEKLLTVDGKIIDGEVAGLPIQYQGDIATLLVVRDVTEQKKVQKQLLKTREEALEAHRVKENFLTVMSHELITPINGMLGLSELSMKMEMPSEASENLKIIHKSTQSLLNIVKDILSISKLEANSLKVDQIPISMDSIRKDLFNLFHASAKSKGIGLLYHCFEEQPWDLIGDPLRLFHILSNLVSNAIKFTKEGEVHLDIKILKQDDKKAWLRFEIQDTGIGISKERLSNLFDCFSQEDFTTTRDHGGIGIGLNLSKKLVELMGGKIGVESEHGKGSLFWLEIPFGKGIKTEREVIKEPDIQFKKPSVEDLANILVVDDDSVNQFVLVRLLKALGFEADTAGNGLEALELIKLKKYRVVFMDCLMPVMDGYQSTREIKAFEKENNNGSQIKVVALTANILEKDQQKCWDAGMDDFVSKPMNLEKLQTVLNKYMH
ncbi:MAG: ATP-binding protein [Deltaproteobacteria bacterium]|nr:ATP-binding protein [Deltaproteobacteria bacterium]